jgi:hypothetical protein
MKKGRTSEIAAECSKAKSADQSKTVRVGG